MVPRNSGEMNEPAHQLGSDRSARAGAARASSPPPAVRSARWPVLAVARPACRACPAPRPPCAESSALLPAACATPLAKAHGSLTRPTRALVCADSADPATAPVGSRASRYCCAQGGAKSSLRHGFSHFLGLRRRKTQRLKSERHNGMIPRSA